MNTDDEYWMRRAIAVARSKGSTPADALFGAVLVRDGAEIAAESNQSRDIPDATAHAEIMTIRRACETLGDHELRGTTLYTTLQPCGMCTMATIWAKIGRIVYGAGRVDVHAMYFECRHVDTLAFVADAYRNDISIEGGCLLDGCVSLYYRPGDDVPIEEQANV